MIKKIMSIMDNSKSKFYVGTYGISACGFLILILMATFLSYRNNEQSLGNGIFYIIVLGIMGTIISTALIINKKDVQDTRNDKIVLLIIFYLILVIFGNKILLLCRKTIEIEEIVKITIRFLTMVPASAFLFSKLNKNPAQNSSISKKNDDKIAIVYNYNKKPEKCKISGEIISEILFSWIILLIVFLFICILFISSENSDDGTISFLGKILMYVYLILSGYIWSKAKIEKYNIFNCIIQATELFAISILTFLFDF